MVCPEKEKEKIAAQNLIYGYSIKETKKVLQFMWKYGTMVGVRVEISIDFPQEKEFIHEYTGNFTENP